MKTTKVAILAAIVLAASLLTGSGRAEAANPPINGPLRVSPVNPRYFTNDTGKAIYLTGSHTWGSFVDTGDANNNLKSGLDNTATTSVEENFTDYLNFLESYNHNFIRLWRFEPTKWKRKFDTGYRYANPHPWKRTGPGNANDGLPKFNLNQFDQAYFDRLRERVIAARDRGIYVSIMFFEGNILYTPDRDPWIGHPFNGANNINGIEGDLNLSGQGTEIHTLSTSVPGKQSMLNSVVAIEDAYVREVIDTVNEFDNVLYEVGNEMGSYSVNFQKHIIQLVKDHESTKPKQHPVGMTQCYYLETSPYYLPNLYTNQELLAGPADWISPGHDKNYPNDTLNPYRTNPPVSDGSKVVIADTDHLDVFGVTHPWIWKVFTRGHNPIFMDTYFGGNGNGPWYYDPAYFTYNDTEMIRKSMGYTLNYANKMNFIDMLPSNSSADCSTTYCLRNPGQEYLIYQPNSGQFTVNLSAGDYNYEWFNPMTGSVAGTGTVTASGGNKAFTAPLPITGEAVLYLKTTAQTDPPTITEPVPSSTLTGSSQFFTWTANGTAVDGWYLWAGPCNSAAVGSCGDDYYNSGQLGSGTLTATATGLPTNGSTVYVRLFYQVGGAWNSQIFSYTAFSDQGNSNPADVNGDTHVNIKDIQICIKGIVNSSQITSEQLQKCQAVAPPDTVVNIKDIQAIIREIVNPSQ